MRENNNKKAHSERNEANVMTGHLQTPRTTMYFGENQCVCVCVFLCACVRVSE